jgi:hypothetical protein
MSKKGLSPKTVLAISLALVVVPILLFFFSPLTTLVVVLIFSLIANRMYMKTIVHLIKKNKQNQDE